MKIQSLVVLLVLLLQKDVLCVNGNAGHGMKRRNDVNIKVSKQPGRADGSVAWKDTLDMEIEVTGKSKKTVQLERKDSPSMGALRKYQKDGVTFSLYSDGKGNTQVCRVKNTNTTELLNCENVGTLNIDGLPCMHSKGETRCPETTMNLDFSTDTLEIPGRRKRSARHPGGRVKRHTTPTIYDLEVCACADESFYAMFVNNVNIPDGSTAEEFAAMFITAMMSEVANMYYTINSPSMIMNIVLLDTYISQTAADAQWANTNTNGIVNFKEAIPVMRTETTTYFDTSLCDVIMGFTTKDLSRTDSPSNTLGVAYVGAACNTNYKFTIIEDRFRTTFVMAHELGHILDADHDDRLRIKGQSCNLPYKIMSSSVGSPDANNDWYGFSVCSIQAFENYVRRASCLSERTYNSTVLESQRCLGFTGNLLDSPEQKCQRLYGVTTFCDGYSPADVNNVCNQLIRCKLDDGTCRSILTNDGFLCETGTEKRCYQGVCMDNAPILCTATTAAPTTAAPTTAAPTTAAPTTAAPTTAAPTTAAPTTAAPTTAAPTTAAPTTAAPTTAAPTTAAPTTAAPTTAAPTTAAPTTAAPTTAAPTTAAPTTAAPTTAAPTTPPPCSDNCCSTGKAIMEPCFCWQKKGCYCPGCNNF